ncbi:MAG: SDR family NAD(P)-dependent oxidoreductase, partial [Candidatus Limnocylindria bacterium]
MDLGIAGRVALIGGASRGIGRAIAHELVHEGCDLVICARGEADLLRAKDELESTTGRTVVAVAADLSEPGAAARIVESGLRELATIDILVTNTGGPPPGRFE